MTLIVMTQSGGNGKYTFDAVQDVAPWTAQTLIQQGRAKLAAINVVYKNNPQWMLARVVPSKDLVVVDVPYAGPMPDLNDNDQQSPL